MGAAAIVAKAALKGIGGGLSGAAKGSQTVNVGDSNTDHTKELYNNGYGVGNMGMDKVGDKIKSKISGAMNKGDDAKTDGDTAKEAGEASEAAEASDAATAAEGAEAASAMSDALLKTVYKDSIDDKIIDNFAKISAIEFKYNDDAHSKYDERTGVDSNDHIGVIAQELQANPVTEGTVKENENGDLVVDTRHLTFADTAAIGELSRRVLALEEAIKELQNR